MQAVKRVNGTPLVSGFNVRLLALKHFRDHFLVPILRRSTILLGAQSTPAVSCLSRVHALARARAQTHTHTHTHTHRSSARIHLPSKVGEIYKVLLRVGDLTERHQSDSGQLLRHAARHHGVVYLSYRSIKASHMSRSCSASLPAAPSVPRSLTSTWHADMTCELCTQMHAYPTARAHAGSRATPAAAAPEQRLFRQHGQRFE